jgi:hypothetical protein
MWSSSLQHVNAIANKQNFWFCKEEKQCSLQYNTAGDLVTENIARTL